MTRRFSVIIAVYNREDFIREAIGSVLAQTFKDFDLIVVDDGSTDQTPEILRSFGDRITVISQANQGSEVAYKTGVSCATGEYMVFLDSDDLFYPHALATYDKILRALDSPPLIIGSEHRLSEAPEVLAGGGGDKSIRVLQYRDYLSKDIRVGLSQSKIVMTKSLFEKAFGPKWESSPCFLNDYHLMLQAGIFGPCVIIKDPPTVIYRQHEGMGSRNIDKMGQGVLQLVHAVRSGRCSGGRARRFDKYAYLGGPATEWSKKAFKAHKPRLALRILLKSWTMIVTNILNKLFILFRGAATPVDIPNE
jgi:glycosyltransferase involved in cell wall biosynthesis